MRTSLIALVIGAAIVVPVAAQKTHVVFASVTTKAGLPAPALTVNDITIREDNQSREIVSIAPVSTPAHVALLIDNSQVTRDMTLELRDGMTAFVNEMLKASPSTLMSVATFGDRPTPVQGWTSTESILTKAVGKTFSVPGSGAYLLDAIMDAARDFKKTPAAHPVIVAFVDEGGQEFSSASRQQVAEALRVSEASLWIVTLKGSADAQVDSPEGRDRQAIIGDGTRQSGGANFLILSKIGLAEQMRKAAGLISTQYEITYGRPDQLVPPKSFELTTSNKDLVVRAPRWSGK